VRALTTAEEYNLENLAYGLLDQQLYVPSKISTNCKYFLPTSKLVNIPRFSVNNSVSHAITQI